MLSSDLVANTGPGLLAVAAFEPFHQAHPDLLHHADRGRVLSARVRADDIRVQPLERVLDQGFDRLRRVPAPLEPRRDRVADLDHAGLTVGGAQPDVSDDPFAAALLYGELHPATGLARVPPPHLLDLRANALGIG